MAALNYRHLRYFLAIAESGGLSRAAERLNLSPSALSVQLKELEESLGNALFERRGRRMILTEAGRIALGYAGEIFRAGDELSATLRGMGPTRRPSLRVGAAATLSRNFTLRLLKPAITGPAAGLVLRSGTLAELLAALAADALDLVLANAPAPAEGESSLRSILIDTQPVSLVRKPQRTTRRFVFPEALRDTPVILPSHPSGVRSSFDAAMEAAGIAPLVLAQVDDMAMLRLLARESGAAALVPPIVVADELKSGALKVLCAVPGLTETFYGIVRRRRFPNPLVAQVLEGYAA